MGNKLLKALFILLLVILAKPLSGQNVSPQPILDSLWHIWQDKNQVDTSRLTALEDFIWGGYIYGKKDSALYYSQIHKDFAIGKGLDSHVAHSYKTMGKTYEAVGEYASALAYYNQSLSIQETLNNKAAIVDILINIGSAHRGQGNYELSLESLHESEVINESTIDKNLSGTILGDIGFTLDKKGEYANAMKYLKEALEIDEIRGNQQNIGRHSLIMGNVFSGQGNPVKALEYYQKSLEIYKDLGDLYNIGSCYHNIGSIYHRTGEFAIALSYYKKCFASSAYEGDPSDAIPLRSIGQAFKSLGILDSALSYFTKSLSITENSGYKEGTAWSHLDIANLYYDNDSFELALGKQLNQFNNFSGNQRLLRNSAFLGLPRSNISPEK